ncbi:hypothetical protein AG0111_0g2517 [Alternaria gaisen]|uniref:Uncharacterized protein n=1 Tax=Alternaria gaisen TaxID=167740 RepID=A0ACB6FX14_9PLEO|nr:hypothetical protein AG0111_0g2517 [Alternaria gaisen]
MENAGNWVMPNPIPKSSWVALRCLLAISPHDRQALATAFIAFMKRPYFSRVWVMQELHLATEISLCCGMDIHSFDYLLAVSMLVDFWANASDYRRSLTGIVTFVANIASWQSWYSRREESCLSLQDDLHDVLPQRGCLTLASGFRGRRRLAEVLEAMQSFQCTDARDRLFGVLALVDWGDGEPAIPDYEMDNYQVAVEVLRLYLNNPGTQPLLKMAVKWPRPLWELFNVSVEREAVREAIRERYGSHRIPGTIHTTYDLTDHLRIGTVEAYSSRREINLLNVPTRPPNIGGHLRDTWYGVKLLDIADREMTNSRNRPPYYLCCKKSYLKSSLDSMHLLVEITDQDGCLFAYAPEDTRPNDRLIISQAGSLSDADPEMAVVRSTNNVHGIYHLIGHAFKDRKYEKSILSTLHWDYFESNWSAEDLFLFDWTYMSRPAGALPRLKSDWLSKVVSTREDSSFFYGPIMHIRDDFAMLKP